MVLETGLTVLSKEHTDLQRLNDPGIRLYVANMELQNMLRSINMSPDNQKKNRAKCIVGALESIFYPYSLGKTKASQAIDQITGSIDSILLKEPCIINNRFPPKGPFFGTDTKRDLIRIKNYLRDTRPVELYYDAKGPTMGTPSLDEIIEANRVSKLHKPLFFGAYRYERTNPQQNQKSTYRA